MFKIIKKEVIASQVIRMQIEAIAVSKNAKSGQFVMVMVNQTSERIPLTIAAVDKITGSIVLIFQEIGFSTKQLSRLNVGDDIFSVLGPLGHPTQIEKYGKVICIGGGVGIAEVYPVSKAFKDGGNAVIGILGARTKEALILEKEMANICSVLHIATDDGTYGKKGFVTGILEGILGQEEKEIGLIYAIGPVAMMARVADITRPYNIKTIVSLNPIMVDATGMCGSCRVSISGETKFGCIDGPEFDAHQVDFNELIERLSFFKEEEGCSNKKCPRK